MDPEELPTLLETIHTTKESSVKLWRLEHGSTPDEVTLDDCGVRDELNNIRKSVMQSEQRALSNADVNGQFILL